MSIHKLFPYACFVVVFLLFSSCDTPRQGQSPEVAATPAATFILVRHAEKDYGKDPVLTEEGEARAERLRFILENEDLAAVYSTDTKRTRFTAAPTATAKGLETKIYDAFELAAFAKQLQRKHAGQKVLVVGHSNTTPSLANFLTGTEDYPRFSELDYTNLYVVTVPAAGEPQVLKLRF